MLGLTYFKIIVSLNFLHMNECVVQLYVAKKMAMRDELFAEAERKMGKLAYKQFAMEQKLSDLPEKMVKDCEKVICRKYGIKHPQYLFPNPTVRQWIADLAKDYQADDLFDFFVQSAGGFSERLQNATIGDTIINRPYLISLIEKLETATGKSLLWPNCDMPLAYLGDDVSYRDIARYFSCGSDVISAKRRKYAEFQDSKTCLQRFAKEVLRVYRVMADVSAEVTDEALLEMRVQTIAPKGIGAGNWDLPIFWTEEKFGLCLVDVPQSIQEKTKVSELIDKFVLARCQNMEREK